MHEVCIEKQHFEVSLLNTIAENLYIIATARTYTFKRVFVVTLHMKHLKHFLICCTVLIARKQLVLLTCQFKNSYDIQLEIYLFTITLPFVQLDIC